ncbi:MAG: phenylalanine--tRNA ligase subunit alpha [Hydrotalea sp.]|nr:phenylalanine--tRNA ligase subunit alpha [Hydrotalea sp.]
MSSTIEDVLSLEKNAIAALTAITNLVALEQWKSKFLGKKSQLNEFATAIATMSAEDKKTCGQAINRVKNTLTAAHGDKMAELGARDLAKKLSAEKIDLTLPARPATIGKLHAINQTIEEAIAILGEMNFVMATGPEVETDFYNFTALNIPESHPARQMQDTFYVNKNDAEGRPLVLRTHTSPVQIRAGEKLGAPLRVMAPGRVYRADSDMTHTPMFHQIEGLVIDKNINFGHLKGCLFEFCRSFFEIADWSESLLRFRPSYFPFTEPSAEVDIAAHRKDGKLTIGTGDSWLEILGSGMVHNNVIKNMGLDPNEWQGFAFGLGVERLAMLKYGIPDLRTFFDSDLRWLEHYGFSPYLQPSLLTSLVI